MKHFPTLLALSLLAILITGCGGGSPKNAVTQTTGRATFTVHWPARKTRLIPEASNSILVTVTRNGATVGTKLLVRPVDPPFDTTASFDPLPTGSLQVMAKAYPNADGTGVAQASGAATLVVITNQNATLNLTIGSTITKVVVSPLSLSIGYASTAAPETLTASAMDVDGNVVLTSGNTFNWSSGNTNYVGVNPTQAMATVNGLAIGETQVTATETESNISGASTVKVLGNGIALRAHGKFRSDLQNTGRSIFGSNVSIVNGTLSLSWCSTTSGQIDASPVVAPDGTVYIGSSNGTLYAFPGRGVDPIWQANVGGRIKSTAAIGADGTVYIASVNGNVAAVYPKDGKFKWQVGYGGASFTSSPTIGSDGTLYLGSQDGFVYAIDGSNGSFRWSSFTGGGIDSSPALSLDGKTLFIGSGDKRMHALNITDGSEKWSFGTGGSIQSSPAVANVPAGRGSTTTMEVVFFGSNDSKMYALKALDGSPFWQTPFSTQGAITSSPAVSVVNLIGVQTQVVLFGSTDTFVYTLDASTGRSAVETSVQLQGGINSSPTFDSKGSVYIGSDDLMVYRLDIVQGNFQITASYRTGGSVSSSPAIGPNGDVYIGSSDAKIYAFGSD